MVAREDGDGLGKAEKALLVTTWNDSEAEMVRQILEVGGIPCQVVSDITHSIYPISVDGLGEVRIFVPAERLQEATELLAEHRRDGMEAVQGEDEEDRWEDGTADATPGNGSE